MQQKLKLSANTDEPPGLFNLLGCNLEDFDVIMIAPVSDQHHVSNVRMISSHPSQAKHLAPNVSNLFT